MQAIAETVFDAVYLVSVITIGVMMMIRSRGNRQFWLFGIMAVVLGAGDAFHLVPRALALCTTGLEDYTISLGAGKWITSITMTVFYVLLYYVWRLRYRVKGKHALTAAVYGLAGLRVIAGDPVHDAPKPVALHGPASFLGHLAEYPLCPAGTGHHRPVFPQCQKIS